MEGDALSKALLEAFRAMLGAPVADGAAPVAGHEASGSFTDFAMEQFAHLWLIYIH